MENVKLYNVTASRVRDGVVEDVVTWIPGANIAEVADILYDKYGVKARDILICDLVDGDTRCAYTPDDVKNQLRLRLDIPEAAATFWSMLKRQVKDAWVAQYPNPSICADAWASHCCVERRPERLFPTQVGDKTDPEVLYLAKQLLEAEGYTVLEDSEDD